MKLKGRRQSGNVIDTRKTSRDTATLVEGRGSPIQKAAARRSESDQARRFETSAVSAREKLGKKNISGMKNQFNAGALKSLAEKIKAKRKK